MKTRVFVLAMALPAGGSASCSLTGVTLGLEASLAGTVGVENLSNAPDMAEGISK